MPMTIPNPSGSTMTAKSFGWSPRVVSAKSGPSTPRTPTSDAAIPRYSSDELLSRDDDRDHRSLGRREEHVDDRDERVEQQDEREVVADEEQADVHQAAE